MFNMLFDTTSSGVKGYTLFGGIHLSIIALGILSVILVIKFAKPSEKFEKILNWSMLLLTLCSYIWFIFGDLSFIERGLPLHTCRLCLFMFIGGLYLKKDVWIKLACYWGLPGGILGLLFPAIYKYPFPHILHLTASALHIYLLAISVYYLFIKNTVMTKQEFIRCNVFTVIYLSFTYVFNKVFGTWYAYTTQMASSMSDWGITLPPIGCLCFVITGYIVVGCIEHKLLLHKQSTNEYNG